MSAPRIDSAQLPEEDNRISRRGLGRRAALSVIAASICANASAQGKTSLSAPLQGKHGTYGARKPVKDLKVGELCKRFLTKSDDEGRPRLRVREILYEPFKDLLQTIIDSTPVGTEKELHDALVAMRKLVVAFKNPDVTVHLLCVNGSTPHPNWDATKWAEFWADDDHKTVRESISTPYYYMEDNNRKKAGDLLNPAGTREFKQKVGSYVYHELFRRNREAVFALSYDGRFGGLPLEERAERYEMVREAFDLGVFMLPDVRVMELAEGHKIDFRSVPNNMCFNLDPPQCMTRQGSYCEVENGVPTSATNICP